MDRRCFLKHLLYVTGGASLGLFPVRAALAAGFCREGFGPPRIALIIDDIGYSRSVARCFLEIDAPITYSILPRLRRTRSLAGEIHLRGHEIMLHQPMEPFDAVHDPGPGALYVDTPSNRIKKILEENLSEVPFAVGVNNHMGSRFTCVERQMETALRVVQRNGLFFVDSRTAYRSRAYAVASRLHIPAARRNIFLDNLPEEPAIGRQLEKLKRHALVFGEAVGIGHPHPETARAIARFLEPVRAAGIEPVYASRVLHP